MIVEYDTEKYRFREAVADALQCRPEQLSTLHTWARDPLRMWQRSRAEAPGISFGILLERFVAEVVSPNMGEPVAYQKRPTFRAIVPSDEAAGIPHCDAEYHHPPAEVNWWIPVTRVWGTNTLHTEGYPGCGDLQPVELEYGQALR